MSPKILRKTDGWSFEILRGISPNVSLNKIPKNVKDRIRLHLDLYTTDQEVEVERMLKMGATLYPRDYKPDDDFKILVDPKATISA